MISTVGENFWIMLTILFLSGNGISTKAALSTINSSVFILIAIISLFLLTIISSLIGMSIIIGSEIENIDSLEELLQRNDINPLMLNRSYAIPQFKDNNVEIYMKTWDRLKINLISNSEFYNDKKLMRDIIRGKKILIDGKIHLYGFARRICSKYPNAKLYLGKS